MGFYNGYDYRELFNNHWAPQHLQQTCQITILRSLTFGCSIFTFSKCKSPSLPRVVAADAENSPTNMTGLYAHIAVNKDTPLGPYSSVERP